MGKNKEIKIDFAMCPNCAKNVLPDKIKGDIHACPECDELFEIVDEVEVTFEADFEIKPTIH